MKVDPVYASVGAFFKNEPMFRIPKYQRGYAWDKDEIDDFLVDLEKLYNARRNGLPKNHFMGGIVSVEHKLPGSVSGAIFELVDGQQRFVTFILFAAAILNNYEVVMGLAQKASDSEHLSIAERRYKKLLSRFIEFEQEINRRTTMQRVIELSKSDDPFFQSLIRSNPVVTERDSHKRIKYAFDQIKKRVTALSKEDILSQYLDNLEILEQNIDNDFSILHIVTYDPKEAYTLFQVLNDRGKNLTEGDLLRAKTLELLENYPQQQNDVEILWNNILADAPRDTEEYMRWIYASHKGLRPGASTLFDDFLNAFYPQHTLSHISTTDADRIFSQTNDIYKEIIHLRKLTIGEWIFPFGLPVTAWDRNRLALLVNELKNKNSLPLLLAGSLLNHKQFAELVSIIERFMFRYTIICNGHHSPVLDIIQNEALRIRSNPSGYTFQNLKKQLQALLDQKADDTFFETSLDTLRYKENNGSNKTLKYFLITIEDYLRWYREGATGSPECKDKSRLFIFADTTIEHIYPRNAGGTVYDAGIDDLKNTIGNLTIMGPSDNSGIGNDEFLKKRVVFKKTTPEMNHEIAEKTQWTRSEVLTRTQEIKRIATKIFKIN